MNQSERILGEILLDNSRYVFYRTMQDMECIFPYDARAQFIFNVMGGILAEGNTVDIVNLVGELEKRNAMHGAGEWNITIYYLSNLIDKVPFPK